MALPATDNFNRAGPTLGANWTGSVGDDLKIVSSTVCTGSGLGDNSMYWSADAPAADQYAQCKLIESLTWCGPFVRGSATDLVVLEADSDIDEYVISWYKGGAWTEIGAHYGTAPAANDVMKITASSTTCKGYINGTERISGTNASIPATGYGGIYVSYNVDNQVDDFEVGNLSSNLTPNKSEASAVTEAIGAVLKPQVNKSETSGVTETIGAVLKPQVSTSEASGVTETVAAALVNLTAITSEDSSVTEAIGVALDNLTAIVSEASEVTEAIGAELSTLQAQVVDTIGVGEASSAAIELPGEMYATVSDGAIVEESVGAALGNLTAIVSEASTVTEAISATLGLETIGASEAIGVAEFAQARIGLSTSATENVTLTDATGAVLIPQVRAAEASDVAESAAARLGALAVYISDSIATGDQPGMSGTYSTTVADGLGVFDAAAVSVSVSAYAIEWASLTDAIRLTGGALQISATEKVHLGETLDRILKPQWFTFELEYRPIEFSIGERSTGWDLEPRVTVFEVEAIQ